MRINKIKFKNINSLKGEHTIDFTKAPLSETGIFAITGAIGSGKSTILDVISLALFNKTPRFTSGLTKNTLAEHGAIITRHTSDAFAEIEYSGKFGKYRSKWAVSVNRNGNLRDYEMEITDLTTNKLLPLKKKEVPGKNEEILGLSYEQFVKSILLSQGEFAKFLKARQEERSALLERITGVDIYRKIGIACFDRHKTETQKLNTFRSQAEMIETLPDEETAQLKVELNEAQNTIKTISANENKLNELFAVKKEIEKNTQRYNSLQEAYKKNEKLINEFVTYKKKLQIHEKTVRFQSDFKELNYLKNSAESAKSKIKKLKEQHLKGKSLLEESYEKHKLIGEGLHKKKLILSELQPVFIKAEELDQQRNQLLEKIEEIKVEISTKNKLKTEKQNEIQLLKKSIDENEKLKNESEVYLSENTLLSDLAYKINTIESEINAFIALKNKFKVSEKKLGKKLIINIETSDSKEIFKALSSKINEINSALAEIEEKAKYSFREMPNLEEKRQELRSKLLDLKKLSELLGNKNEIQKQLNLKFDNNEKIKILTARAEDEKNDILKQKEIILKYIEELSVKYERQLLEKNYEKDRKNLKEEEACPLCGSKHHPLVKNYKNQTNKTQNRLNEKKQKAKTLENKLLKIEKEIIKHNSDLKSNKNFISEKETLLNEIKQSVNKLTEQLKCNETDEKSIEHLKNKIINEGIELKDEINLLNKLNALKTEKSELLISYEKVKTLYEAEKKLFRYKENYSAYLKNVSGYKSILKTLQSLSRNYTEAENKLTECKNTISENKKVLELKQNDYSSVENELKTVEQRVELLQANVQTIKNERHELFGNKNPKTEEKKLNQEIERITTQAYNLSKQIASLEAEINSISTNLEEIQANLEETESDFNKKEQKLLFSLSQIGFKNIESAINSILSYEAVEEIKTKDEELQNKKISIGQSLDDVNKLIKDLNAHDNKTVSMEVLENQIKKNNELKQEKNKAIGVITNRLKTDAKNRKKSEDIKQALEKQEKETLKWETLARLIGDAKGKKFTEYAQKLTLRQLFILANKHLKLIDGRYLIDVKNDSADIFVLDSYQGNVSRSVKTLSGGESFLVSLALALGLSDLAGSNTQINSLFIDEGFGSLDQQSLDTALSALEKLQNESNKTIGIISHVSSLKERIQTQIRLKKQNSGYSEMEIV